MSKPGITAANIIRAAKQIGYEEAMSGQQADWEAIEKDCEERTKALQKKLTALLSAEKSSLLKSFSDPFPSK
jgi:hypothetical protein